MRRLTFRNGWDLKKLKSGIEVILHILICFNGMPMWAYIKDSCKQLFLLQDSMARSKAVCLDFKSGTPGGAGFEGTSQSGLATVWEREIKTRLSPKKKKKKKGSDENRSLKTWSRSANDSCRRESRLEISREKQEFFGESDPNLPHQTHETIHFLIHSERDTKPELMGVKLVILIQRFTLTDCRWLWTCEAPYY